MKDQELLSQNINAEFDQKLALGERVADFVASFEGSWTFIMAFGAFFVLWMGINSIALLRHPFDPFPYILLNLLLSCLTAIQAPVIMMSALEAGSAPEQTVTPAHGDPEAAARAHGGDRRPQSPQSALLS